FLRKLMKARPTPVVICSTLTVQGAETTMQALRAGAVSIIAKPASGVSEVFDGGANDVVAAVKAAAQARGEILGRGLPEQTDSSSALSGPGRPAALSQTTQQVVAIGPSTGGTQALARVLPALPAVTPGIVIVQHMPEKFPAMFAQRLDS